MSDINLDWEMDKQWKKEQVWVFLVLVRRQTPAVQQRLTCSFAHCLEMEYTRE